MKRVALFLLSLMAVFVTAFTVAARREVRPVTCHVMREAIARYTADRKTAPRSAKDLLREGYLDAMPQYTDGGCVSDDRDFQPMDSPMPGRRTQKDAA